MMDEDQVDRKIGALLRGPANANDERFVRRLERRLAAERQMEAARRASWRRFGAEAVASLAVLAAFILLYGFVPEGPSPLSPGVAAVLLIGLWFLVELRPAAARG